MYIVYHFKQALAVWAVISLANVIWYCIQGCDELGITYSQIYTYLAIMGGVLCKIFNNITLL